MMGRKPAAGSEPSQEELAALASGWLAPERRREVEAWVDASPGLAGLLEEQRRAAAAVRGVRTAAPEPLRAWVEGERLAARVRRVTRRRAIALGAGGAALCLGGLLVLAGDDGAPAPPTVTEVARVAMRSATGAAPAADPLRPELLALAAAGVPFPSWRERFGWRATGMRTDLLSGRRTTTVFYGRGRRRVAYTVVSGPPLEAPDGAASKLRGGTRFHSLERERYRVVTWARGGRTCVLSGDGVSGGTLLRLAAWRGDGAVPF